MTARRVYDLLTGVPALIAGFSFVRLIAAVVVPLLPEEAYHWTFAKHPALSYLDHPPMMAYLMAASTAILGDTKLGVRLPFVVLGTGTMVFAYLTARLLFGPRAGVIAVLLLGLMPVTLIMPAGAFPDGPLLFFCSSFLYFAYRALLEDRVRKEYAAGAAAGLAMLSKYTAALMLGGFFVFLLSGPHRRRLRSPHFWAAVAVALALFMPVLVWNAHHDWASFRFQFVRRAQQAESFTVFNLVRFCGQQLAIVSPLLVVPLAVGVWRLTRSRSELGRSLLLCGAAVIVPFALVSARASSHVLWTAHGYYPLILAAAGGLAQGDFGRGRTFRALLVFEGVLLLVSGLYVMLAPPVSFAHRKLFVWQEAARQTREVLQAMSPDSFVIGYGREFTVESELAFHLGQETFAKDVVGDDGMQYAFWTDYASLKGRDALLVADSRKYLIRALGRLALCFDRFEVVNPPEAETPREPHELRFYFVRCYGYRGRPVVADPSR